MAHICVLVGGQVNYKIRCLRGAAWNKPAGELCPLRCRMFAACLGGARGSSVSRQTHIDMVRALQSDIMQARLAATCFMLAPMARILH